MPSNEMRSILMRSFAGSLVKESDIRGGRASIPLGNVVNSFDEFTARDETNNIAVWTGNLFRFLGGPGSRVSREVPVAMAKGDRNGRLDVVLRMGGWLYSIETKTSLAEAIRDRRFADQMAAYEFVLSQECNRVGLHYQQILVVGGEESDLLPRGHRQSSLAAKDPDNRFYSDLIRMNLRFVTTRALLLLGLSELQSGVSVWRAILSELNGPGFLGLTSAGLVNSDFDLVTPESGTLV